MRVLLELNGTKSTVEFANCDYKIAYTTKYSRKYSIRTFLSTAIDNRDARIYRIEIQSDNSDEQYVNYYIFPGPWLLKQCNCTQDKMREIAILNTEIKLEKSAIKNNDIIDSEKLIGNNKSIDEGIQHLTGKLKEAQEKKIGFC